MVIELRNTDGYFFRWAVFALGFSGEFFIKFCAGNSILSELSEQIGSLLYSFGTADFAKLSCRIDEVSHECGYNFWDQYSGFFGVVSISNKVHRVFAE